VIEIGVQSLEKQFGETVIFENITFDLKSGERVGLIGANGTGKTTIMKILMKVENVTKGEVFKRKGATLGYLNQIPNYENYILVKDVIMLAFKNLHQMKKDMIEMENKMVDFTGKALEQLMKQYGEKSHLFEQQGGYMMDTELSKITNGLNIDEVMLERKFNQLSGGEQTRVVLGRILLEKPDVLLLDEPTNHLDIESREVLEENLLSYEGTLLFISHDRYFVDKLASKIGEISNGYMILYNGTYDYYKEEKAKLFKKNGSFIPLLNTKEKYSDSVSYESSVEIGEKKLSKNAKVLLVKIEKEIEELEAVIEEKETSLMRIGHDHGLLTETMKEIEKLKSEVEELYDKWEQITI